MNKIRVRFLEDDDNAVPVWIHPAQYYICPKGSRDTIVIRQLALLSATAVTIHKVQGGSFEWLGLWLECIFEFGQAYVGLSRSKLPPPIPFPDEEVCNVLGCGQYPYGHAFADDDIGPAGNAQTAHRHQFERSNRT